MIDGSSTHLTPSRSSYSWIMHTNCKLQSSRNTRSMKRLVRKSGSVPACDHVSGGSSSATSYGVTSAVKIKASDVVVSQTPIHFERLGSTRYHGLEARRRSSFWRDASSAASSSNPSYLSSNADAHSLCGSAAVGATVLRSRLIARVRTIGFSAKAPPHSPNDRRERNRLRELIGDSERRLRGSSSAAVAPAVVDMGQRMGQRLALPGPAGSSYSMRIGR